MTKPLYWNTACIELSKKDPILGLIIKQYHNPYLVPSNNPFRTLCKSIISQQISTSAAKSIYVRFENISLLKPRRILTLSDSRFREIGLSKQKIEYLKILSEKTISSEINLVGLKNLHETKTFEILTDIKGIGPWTANMFLIFYCLNPNIFPSNDLGLINGLKQFYKKSDYQIKTNIFYFKHLWAPWCTVGSFYIWRALDGEPLNY